MPVDQEWGGLIESLIDDLEGTEDPELRAEIERLIAAFRAQVEELQGGNVD